LLDQIVEMNDQFLTGMNRRSRTAVELRRKSLRRRARDGLQRLLGAVDALVAADGAQTVANFREAQDAPALIEAAIACRAYERLEARGHLDAMLARYATLRQYLPAFLGLPLQAAAGSETLVRATEVLRALDAGTRGALTKDDPHSFVQADWRPHLIIGGKLDRAIWEISLAFAVRDALRAGSLYLAKSRDHVSFWNLVYDDISWRQTREQAYQRLGLPTDGQEFLTRITAEFDKVARAAERGLASNRFAAIRDGKLKLKKRDALPISRVLRELRATIGASLPRVRIEDLLQDVDEWSSFTGAFQPLGGYEPRGVDPHRSLLATLIAHGTNLGLAAMSQSVDSVTAETLQDTNGFTEHLFGLCALLGITFMPRLKDLPDQVLSRIDREADYGALQPLLRGSINLALIREQWDQLVRLAASLKDRLTPAHVIMQRLINTNASDRLAGALSQLGRLMKTLHILRYIQEEPLRDAIQLQLNRGEFRHILAKWLFFANQGGFRSGDYEEVMNKASSLSLLSNAVLVWNTVHIARIVDQLRAAGHEVRDEDLARVSPLAHAHVIPNGSYFQSPRRRAQATPQPAMA